jgi:hypothetical protein
MSATEMNLWLYYHGKEQSKNPITILNPTLNLLSIHIRLNMYTVTKVKKPDKTVFTIQKISQFI